MANQRNLKAFVRFDGSGRIVAGSLVLRKNKPKVGRWYEIPAYQCCNDVPTVLTDTIPGEFPLSYISIRIFCDESTADTVYTNGSAENMTELINLLNDNEGTRQFGTYVAVDDTTVQLTVPLSVKNRLCPNGTLSFNIFED
jgi:hypothetical protein